MGELHANGWRVSRHRLVAGATVGVIGVGVDPGQITVSTEAGQRRRLSSCNGLLEKEQGALLQIDVVIRRAVIEPLRAHQSIDR